ncbi:MAG: hypothetical protein WAV04_03800 [Candidatus Microsaccharimonas sp.]
MINIFDDQKAIDESNFLEYDIRKLSGANTLVQYREAIARLDEIRAVLQIIRNINRINEVGNRAYYIEALRWLKGETALNNWHHVPHTPDLTVMQPEIAQAFDLYTQQLKQNLSSEVLYSQTELAIQVAPLVKARPVVKTVEKVVEVARDDITNIASVQKSELEALKNEVQNNVSASINQARQDSEANFRSIIADSYNQIDERTNNAISKVRQATNLRDWGEVYDTNVFEISEKLYGRNTSSVLQRNADSLVQKLKNVSRERKSINWWKLFLKAGYIVFKNFTSLITISLSKLTSIAGRRTISFLLLATSAVVIAALPLIAIITGDERLHIFNPSDPIQWITKITIWLPIIIIFSLAYSFTTKNYRIYANMLDQYKHRRAVAKTAQGIILSIDPNSGDAKLRDTMTAAAATALFEHKVTGHLSKKEVESLGLLDVIRTIGK